MWLISHKPGSASFCERASSPSSLCHEFHILIPRNENRKNDSYTTHSSTSFSKRHCNLSDNDNKNEAYLTHLSGASGKRVKCASSSVARGSTGASGASGASGPSGARGARGASGQMGQGLRGSGGSKQGEWVRSTTVPMLHTRLKLYHSSETMKLLQQDKKSTAGGSSDNAACRMYWWQ